MSRIEFDVRIVFLGAFLSWHGWYAGYDWRIGLAIGAYGVIGVLIRALIPSWQ